MTRFVRETSGAEVVSALGHRVDGKIIAITGPSTGGLGAGTATSLASSNPPPHTLLLLGRSLANIQPVIDSIHQTNSSIAVKFVPLDLTSQTSVRTAASTILNDDTIPRIDILINNAGVMAIKEFTTTSEGIETQFGANHVGHFLLTNLLMPKVLLAATASPSAQPPRIINVSSKGHELTPAEVEDYNFKGSTSPEAKDGDNYNPWVAYGRSKSANISFARSLAKKVGPKGVLAFSLHPGIISTNLANHIEQALWASAYKVAEDANEQYGKGRTAGMDFPAKTMEQGCSTTLVAALDDELESEGVENGSYLMDCKVLPSEGARPWVRDEALAEKLWGLSEKLVGEKFIY